MSKYFIHLHPEYKTIIIRCLRHDIKLCRHALPD